MSRAPLALAALILLASLPALHDGPSAEAGQPLPLDGAAFHPSSMALSGALPAQPGGLPSPDYDEQIGATFTQDFPSLTYNVTAIAQADAYGYGPGYLLNGLTPAGYWYQVGISYHWPDSEGTYAPSFAFNYEVYGPNGKSVFPSGGGAGEAPFTGAVYSGNAVLLSLTFTATGVEMSAHDWSTGASEQASFTADGSTTFVGDTASATSPNGYFSGLMTEWYHVGEYSGNEGGVTYSNEQVALEAGWIWIDEFHTGSTNSLVFSNQTSTPIIFANQKQLYPFSAGGVTAYLSAHEFITGELQNLSSSGITILPAAPGLSSPSISATYTLSGQEQTATLAAGTNVVQADPGTSITVSVSSASGSLDRWVFNGTSGTEVSLPAGTNASYVYYHLVPQTVFYEVAGGGEGPPASSPPQLTYEEPPAAPSGTASEVTATQVLGGGASVVYAIMGSEASLNESAGGSGERWAASAESWPVTGPNAIPEPIELYQQYNVSVSYTIVGGGSPSQTPDFNSTSFGSPAYVSLSPNGATTAWFDAGSSYVFTGILNSSSSTERWQLPLQLNQGGLAPTGISAPNQVFRADYVHQYHVDLGTNNSQGGSVAANYTAVSSGGTVTPGPGWLDAGLNLTVKASPNQGWQFEKWSGSGRGALNGTSQAIGLTVAGPLSENATFYAGLAITAQAGTNVAYSSASASGTVQAGTTKEIYLPPGSSATLRASPTFLVYSFGSWKGEGLVKQTKPSIAVVVDLPMSVTAASSLDYPVVLTLAAVALLVILAAALSIPARRARRDPGMFVPG